MTEKSFTVQGNWYAPRDYILSLPGCIWADLVDTTNSGGSWSGIACFKQHNRLEYFGFSQENNSWSTVMGYEVNTWLIATSSINQPISKHDLERLEYSFI